MRFDYRGLAHTQAARFVDALANSLEHHPLIAAVASHWQAAAQPS